MTESPDERLARLRTERADRAEAKVAAVEALAEEWEQTQQYNRRHIGQMLLDTPGPADLRGALGHEDHPKETP